MSAMPEEIEEYLLDVPPSRRTRIQQLIELIRSTHPDAVGTMRYRMPTFDGEHGWVAVANQKRYVSLYTCFAPSLASFKEQCPGVKTGKGCINFADRDEFHVAAIQAVIEAAMSRGAP